MAQFGAGVNPQLGAIDYSAYSQGAAQGSAAIGRGIASLGAGIGEGLEKYAETQKQNKEKDAQIKSTIKLLESFQDVQGIDPAVRKVTLDALGGLHDSKASRDDLYALSQAAGKQISMVMLMGHQAKQDEIQRTQAFAQLQETNARIMAGKNKQPSFDATEVAFNAMMADYSQNNDGKIAPPATRAGFIEKIKQFGVAPNVSIGGVEPGNITTYNPKTGTATTVKVSENPAEVKKQEAARSASALIDDMSSQYVELNKLGAIRDSTKGSGANIQAFIESSGVGQIVGQAFGTKEQALRDSIKQAAPLILIEFKNATGMTAQQLNSDADVKLMLSAIADPASDVGVALKALQRLKARIGTPSSGSSTEKDSAKRKVGRFTIVEEPNGTP